MARSMSRAQADAIASGFLDSIGSTEDAAFIPNNSLSVLIQLASFFVEEAQNNLNKEDRVATGALSDSIRVQNPVANGRNIVVPVMALFYYKFVNKGVKGTRRGRSLANYSFKNEVVSYKMLKKIRQWLVREGLKRRSSGQGKPIVKRERKRTAVQKSSDVLNSKAYAVSRSIKMKGLKPTKFFDDAEKATQKLSKQLLGKALALDLTQSLPKKI